MTRWLVLALLLVGSLPAEAANRYWVGGGSSANWNATGNTNWGTASGVQDNASVPTSSDDVFFDGVGTGASNSTLSANITVRSVDFTGYANTLTHNASVTLSIGDGTAGAGNNALVLAAGMTYTLGGTTTSAISFISTSATQQSITFAGIKTGNLTFNGAGGSWLFADNMATATAGISFTLTAGTIDTNGKNVSLGSFASSNSNTRTLTLGASTVDLASGLGGVTGVWTCTTSTNFTLNAGTSTINMYTNTGTIGTFAGGGLTYNNVVFQGNGTGGVAVTGANTFANLTYTGGTQKSRVLRFGANQIITGTLTINGNSAINRPLVTSDVIGTARTLTAATVTVTNADFRDITGAGAGSWDLSAITGNSGDCGGNSGITFTTAATQTATGTSGFTWSTHGWTSRVPLPQDDVVINNAFSASQTVTGDMPRMGKNVDWTGATGSPTWSVNDSIGSTLFGSLTMISGMTLSTPGSGAGMTFEGRGSFTLTNAGKSFDTMLVQMSGGTLTLQDALTTAATLTLTMGTLDFNNFSCTLSQFSSSGALTRTLTLGSGTTIINGTGSGQVWSMSSSITITATTGTIKFTQTNNSDQTFVGQGKTYGNLYFSRGASTAGMTITGANTFSDLKDDGTAAHTITFPNSTTTVSSWNINGTAGNLITLQRTGASGTWTISDASGNECGDYLSISNSTATGGATWYAGANSTDGGGNTGWSFSACPGAAARRVLLVS